MTWCDRRVTNMDSSSFWTWSNHLSIVWPCLSCELSYCCCLVTKFCSTLCDPVDCRTPGFPVHHYLLEFAQTHVHWVSEAIQRFHPLSLPSPPALNLSQHQGLFKWVSFFCIRWPKYCSFSFSISPSNEYSGLICFRIDWLALLAVQGTLKNLLQHHGVINEECWVGIRWTWDPVAYL